MVCWVIIFSLSVIVSRSGVASHVIHEHETYYYSNARLCSDEDLRQVAIGNTTNTLLDFKEQFETFARGDFISIKQRQRLLSLVQLISNSGQTAFPECTFHTQQPSTRISLHDVILELKNAHQILSNRIENRRLSTQFATDSQLVEQGSIIFPANTDMNATPLNIALASKKVIESKTGCWHFANLALTTYVQQICKGSEMSWELTFVKPSQSGRNSHVHTVETAKFSFNLAATGKCKDLKYLLKNIREDKLEEIHTLKNSQGQLILTQIAKSLSEQKQLIALILSQGHKCFSDVSDNWWHVLNNGTRACPTCTGIDSKSYSNATLEGQTLSTPKSSNAKECCYLCYESKECSYFSYNVKTEVCKLLKENAALGKNAGNEKIYFNARVVPEKEHIKTMLMESRKELQKYKGKRPVSATLSLSMRKMWDHLYLLGMNKVPKRQISTQMRKEIRELFARSYSTKSTQSSNSMYVYDNDGALLSISGISKIQTKEQQRQAKEMRKAMRILGDKTRSMIDNASKTLT